MDISMNDKVNSFLTDIQFKSPEQFELMLQIRELFLNSNKALVEEFKYGGLVFNLSNSLIGGIYSYKEHLSIEFSNGADFTDENSILEGGGKKRRHLKINVKDDIEGKNCAFFIAQASTDS